MSTHLPKNLEIEVTNICNLKCETCRRGRKDFVQAPRQDMTFEEFKKIIDQFPELDKLQFCGEAENTLNPALPDMIEYARSRGVKWIEMFTNGTTLGLKLAGTEETVAERLAKTSIDMIKFSIDGARPETYQELRHFDLNFVLENIRTFRTMTSIPFGVEMVVSALNIDELIEVPAMAAGIGAEEIEFRLLGWVADDLEDLKVDGDRMNAEIEQVEAIKGRFNVKRIIYTPPERAREQECLIGEWVNVDSRGNMTVCYYRETDTIGNLIDEDLTEIWERSEMETHRVAYLAGDFHPECTCPMAVYCGKERSES